MNVVEYNLRISIMHAIILFGVAWIFYGFCNLSKNRKIKALCVAVGAVVGVLIISSCFLSLTYNECVTAQGKIDEVVCTGSLGGFLDQYTIYVTDNNGEKQQYSTSIFSSSKYKARVSQLEQNDIIEIYANNVLDIVYRFYLL